MENEPMERCDNCLKEYPESKMATHFGYCRRNIKKCPICHDMYDINFQEQHDEEFHKQEECPHCHKSFPSAQLKNHENKCTKKPRYCEYCDLNVPVETFPVHLKQCESRTKPCTKCNRPITNKEYLVHLVSCDGIKEEPKIVQPPPVRTYQEHIQYQRRVIEPSSQVLANNRSKDKISQPYQYKREEKHYAPIVNERPGQRVIYNQPARQEVRTQIRQEIRYADRPGVKQEPKREEKKESEKYIGHRLQPRKQEPKKYITSINPPTSSTSSNANKYNNNAYKKEDARSSKPSEPQKQPGVYDYRREGAGSRQPRNGATRDTGSNKNIYTSSSNAPKSRTYGTQEVKESSDKYGVRQSKPQYKAPSQPITKAPEVKTRVIYETRTQQQPQHSHDRTDFLQEEYALGALDINGEDHQLQMAIMQSMGGSNKTNKNSSYTFENEWSNPSFVAQQKAIEEQLSKQRRR